MLPFGVVVDDSVAPPVVDDSTALGADSTALGAAWTALGAASTALGAASTALPRAVPLVPLFPRVPCANAVPDSTSRHAAVVVIVLMGFIGFELFAWRRVTGPTDRAADCSSGDVQWLGAATPIISIEVAQPARFDRSSPSHFQVAARLGYPWHLINFWSREPWRWRASILPRGRRSFVRRQ